MSEARDVNCSLAQGLSLSSMSLHEEKEAGEETKEEPEESWRVRRHSHTALLYRQEN